MPAGGVLTVTLWPWIHAGRFSVDFALQMDALSAVMTLIVTGVGALIHIYSVGYMAHDEDFARFFAYLNLFELSMLMLVLANNLLLMFIGWEGVGLCSYLLIRSGTRTRRTPTTGARPSSSIASATRDSCSACSRLSPLSARTESGPRLFSPERQRTPDGTPR